MRTPEGRTIFVFILASANDLDPSGEIAFKRAAIRLLDRIRVAVSSDPAQPTPECIRTLRESIGMTQTQFAQRLLVDKITVARRKWGKSRPTDAKVNSLDRLRRALGKKASSSQRELSIDLIAVDLFVPAPLPKNNADLCSRRCVQVKVFRLCFQANAFNHNPASPTSLTTLEHVGEPWCTTLARESWSGACTPASSKGSDGPTVPVRFAGPRHCRASASRSYAAGCAG